MRTGAFRDFEAATHVLVCELLLQVLDLDFHFLDLSRGSALIQPTGLRDLRLVLAARVRARVSSSGDEPEEEGRTFSRPRFGTGTFRSLGFDGRVDVPDFELLVDHPDSIVSA